MRGEMVMKTSGMASKTRQATVVHQGGNDDDDDDTKKGRRRKKNIGYRTKLSFLTEPFFMGCL